MSTKEIRNITLHFQGTRIIYKFNQPIVRIGREGENDLIIEDAFVSRKHSEIRNKGDRYEIVDLNSTSGTFVNGKQIEEILLSNGDYPIRYESEKFFK